MVMASNVVVIGTQWGDEGKGKSRRLADRSRAGRGAFPGRPQRRAYAGDRRQENRAAPDTVRHPAARTCVATSATAWWCRRRRCWTRLATLENVGVEVRARLKISDACPLILPYHVALDQARENAKGEGKIGTTGRGIGPAYEDKVARRAIRLQDLFHRERFAAKLGEVLDYHNFVLKQYFNAASGRFSEDAGRDSGAGGTLSPDGCRRAAPAVRCRQARQKTCCSKARKARCSISITARIRT